MVQIVLNPYRARQDTNSVWWVLTENGAAPYLDTSYPYTNVTANIAVDSPITPLLNGYLPAHRVGVVPQEIGQLQRLLDLLEEDLDLPPAPMRSCPVWRSSPMARFWPADYSRRWAGSRAAASGG
jgi:hypothetical protein